MAVHTTDCKLRDEARWPHRLPAAGDSIYAQDRDCDCDCHWTGDLNSPNTPARVVARRLATSEDEWDRMAAAQERPDLSGWAPGEIVEVYGS